MPYTRPINWKIMRLLVQQNAATPEQASRIVLEHLGINERPVDIQKMLGQLDIEYKYHPELEVLVAVSIDNDRAVIEVRDQSIIQDHQRFIIAHVLGRIFLDRIVPTEILIQNDRSIVGSMEKTRANQFAAGIIMPMWMIEACIQQKGITGDKLSKSFNVSKTALCARIKQLNGHYIDWRNPLI